MNWGGFASGFSQGFNNGIAIGKSVKQAMKEKAIEDATQSGIADAKAKQDAFISAAVREQGIPQATAATQATGQPELTSTPQASQAPNATTYPAAEDPMTADRTQPPPVDASLEGAPKPTPKAPELTSTPQASAAPKEPVAPPPEPPTTASTAAASGIPGANRKTRFMVGDKAFDTREDALKYAKESAPTVMDFMTKTLVPKMQQAYLEQGDIEKAEAWGKWAKERDNEKHMENWAKAFKSYQSGDFVSSAKHLVAMHADFPDGNTIVGAEPVKDKAGNVTGFNMSVKNDQTGETRSQFVDPKTLTEYGLGALSPDKMFNAVYQRQSAADALAAKARIDAQNDERTYKREMAKQGMIEDRADKRSEAADRRAAAKDERQHGYKLEELATAEQLKQAGVGGQERAKLQAKIDLAKENGATPDEIKAMVPHLLGGAGYKKTTDPTERRAIVIDTLMKNDPTFSTADASKQEEKVKRMMTLTYGADTPAAAAPAKPGAAPKKGTPFLTPDGKVIYR